MTKEKIEGSPLKRRLTLGVQTPAQEPIARVENGAEEPKLHGDKESRSGKRKLSVYFTEPLATRFQVYAKQHHTSVSILLEQLAEKFLGNQE